MNKKLFISTAIIAFLASTGINAAMADEVKAPVDDNEYAIQKPMAHHYMGEVPKGAKYFGPGPQIDKNHPMKFNGPKHFNKAEMQAKKAEFEKRLNLTEEQKKQIEENRKNDHEKVKPVVEQIKQKRQEIKSVIEDTKLSEEEKSKKTAELLKELDALKLQADNLRKENMQNFENVLTEKQKKEFAKIKKEQKQEMEKRKKQFEKSKRGQRKYIKPVQPTPQPVKE